MQCRDRRPFPDLFRRRRDVRHLQGSVGLAGSGADLIVDNATFAAGQGFTVTQFDIAAGNA
jgi:hypothetical protein